ERRFASRRAAQPLEKMIARPHRAPERSQCRVRLNRDAVPAGQIKCKRDVVVDRMAGADIDIEAVRYLAEAAPEMEVLETLRVGKGRERHAVYLSNPYKLCSVRTALSVRTASIS